MGVNDREQDRKQELAEARRQRAALPDVRRNTGGEADWENADANLMKALVCAVAALGGAVRYGYTRDGGAYSIGIYLGDQSKTYYCNEKEGIDETIRELGRHFEK